MITLSDIAAAAATDELLYALLNIYQHRRADQSAMQELIAVCTRRATANYHDHAAEYTALANLAQVELSPS